MSWTSEQFAAYQAKMNPPAPLEHQEMEIDPATKLAEKELQSQILAYLRIRDIFPGCPIFGRKSTMPEGWPDIVFVSRGKPFALEVKVGNNQPTPEQVRVGEAMMLNGWNWHVVRSLAEVRDLLKEPASE